jgi:hypothetical protein
MSRAATVVAKIVKAICYLLGGFVALVLTVLVAVYLLLQTEFFTRFVLDQALPPVEKLICAKIQVESLRLRLLPFRLEIRGAKYTDPQEKYPYPFAKLDRLLVTAHTLPLFSGQVVVREVLVEGAENYLYIRDGLENLPICPMPDEPDEEDEEIFRLKLPIVVENVRVDAKFRMDIASYLPEPTPEEPEPEPTMPLNITVNSILVTAQADLNKGETAAQVRIGDAALLIGEMFDRVEQLAIDAQANLQNWDGKVTRLDLTMPDLTLAGTAHVKDMLTELEAGAQLQLNGELHKANRLVLKKDDDLQLRGPFALDVNAGVRLGEEKLTYQADASLRVPEAKVNQLAVRDLRLELAADQDRASVSRLHANAAGGAVDLQAHIAYRDDFPVSGAVNVMSVNAADLLRSLLGRDFGAAGVVGADLAANGRLKPFQIDARGEVEVAGAAYGDAVRAKSVRVDLDATSEGATNRIHQLHVEATETETGGSMIPQATVAFRGVVGPKRNVIETLSVETPGTTIRAQGLADLAGALKLDVDAQFEDLAEFSGFAKADLAGQGGFRAQVGGTAKKPDVHGDLRFTGVKYGQVALDQVSADLSLVGKRAAVSNLVVEGAATSLRVDAAYDWAGAEPLVSATVLLPKARVEELVSLVQREKPLPLSGDVSLQATLNGPVKSLNGNVAMQGRALRAFGENVERVNLDAQLLNGEVRIADLSVVKRRGIRPAVSRGVWRARTEKQATPEEREPAKLVITGNVHPWKKTFALKLQAANLTEMAADRVSKNRMQVMGDVDLVADLHGSFENPEGELRFALERARWKHLSLGRSALALSFRDQRVQLDGELLVGRVPGDIDDLASAPASVGPATTAPPPSDVAAREDPDFASPGHADAGLGKIKLSASLALTDELPLEAEVAFDQFDFTDFLREPEKEKLKVKAGRRATATAEAPAEKGDELRGLLAGTLTVAANLARPETESETAPSKSPFAETLRATVRLDDLQLRKGPIAIRNQDAQGRMSPVIITYADGRVSVPSFALGGGGVQFTLANATLRGEEFLVLSGTADLGVVAGFTDVLAESSGQATLHAEIPVAWDLAKVAADLSVPKGNFSVKNLSAAIENVALEARLENRVLTLKTLTADCGGGKLRGGGAVRLPESKPSDDQGAARPIELDLFVKLEGVKAAYDPYADVSIDKAELLITNRRDGKIDVSGDVGISRAVFSVNVDLPSILKALQSPKEGAAGSEVYEKKEEQAYFNVGVHADRNVVFDNNFATVEFKVDLLLTGNNVDLGMIGTVDVLKGQAMVWNNDYKVTNATVQFVDETRILPVFDINAQTTVREIKVFVNVSGTPDRYQITLASDPPTSEQNIVSLLSVGVSYEEYQTSGAGISSDQMLALAAQQLLGSQVQSYTGLDIGVDNSRGQPFLKASREVRKDLNLALFRGISDPTLAAELEYGLVRYMAVYVDWSNFAGQKDAPPSGGYGAGLRLKIEYR